MEIEAGGSRGDALRAGAETGLARVTFARLVDRNGEVELEVEVSELEEDGASTVCRVKILVLRLPSDALLGIAEGGARVRGSDAGDACVDGLAASLIKGKIRGLLRRELRDRR